MRYHSLAFYFLVHSEYLKEHKNVVNLISQVQVIEACCVIPRLLALYIYRLLYNAYSYKVAMLYL